MCALHCFHKSPYICEDACCKTMSNDSLFVVKHSLVSWWLSNLDFARHYNFFRQYKQDSLNMFLSRLIVTGGLNPILTRVGYSMNLKHVMVITWGGLKGAVSLALALSFAQTETIDFNTTGSKVNIMSINLLMFKTFCLPPWRTIHKQTGVNPRYGLVLSY